EALATEREQHRLLLEICSSLDRLGELGGSRLFWGEDAGTESSAEHIRGVLARVAQFTERMSEIEGRRAAVIDRINQQQSHASFMEDILFEALEEEERRKHEWIIEREIGKLPARKASMPWARGDEEDKRFRKSVSTALLV